MTTSTALYYGQEENGHGHTPVPLRTRKPDLLFSRRYAMTTFTALYRGQQEDDHLEDDGPGHGQLGPAFLVFISSYTLKEDLGIGGNQGCC